eukprot:14014198-Alexandrium_andersonii.AAC.1
MATNSLRPRQATTGGSMYAGANCSHSFPCDDAQQQHSSRRRLSNPSQRYAHDAHNDALRPT